MQLNLLDQFRVDGHSYNSKHIIVRWYFVRRFTIIGLLQKLYRYVYNHSNTSIGVMQQEKGNVTKWFFFRQNIIRILPKYRVMSETDK